MLDGALASALPVRHRLLRQACLRVVMRHQLWLGLGRGGKVLDKGLGNALVILPAGAPQQCLIGGVLHQGMLEGVGGLGSLPILVHQLGRD
jgi:hypothetical protein